MSGKPPVRFGSPMWRAEREFRDASIAAHIHAKQAGIYPPKPCAQIESRRLEAICGMFEAARDPENGPVPGEVMEIVLGILRCLQNNERPAWLDAAARRVRATTLQTRQCYRALATYVRAAQGSPSSDPSLPRQDLAIALADDRAKDTVMAHFNLGRPQRVNQILKMPLLEKIDPFEGRYDWPVETLADAIRWEMKLGARTYRETRPGAKAPGGVLSAGPDDVCPRAIFWGKEAKKIDGV